MNKYYDSYKQAALYNRAIAARIKSTRINLMDFNIEISIKNDLGYNYITPAAMAYNLDCDMFELMKALEQHKRDITKLDPKLLLVANYGNANFEVHAWDPIKLQGWINFLSLDCFADSVEAKAAVEAMKKRVEL